MELLRVVHACLRLDGGRGGLTRIDVPAQERSRQLQKTLHVSEETDGVGAWIRVISFAQKRPPRCFLYVLKRSGCRTGRGESQTDPSSQWAKTVSQGGSGRSHWRYPSHPTPRKSSVSHRARSPTRRRGRTRGRGPHAAPFPKDPGGTMRSATSAAVRPMSLAVGSLVPVLPEVLFAAVGTLVATILSIAVVAMVAILALMAVTVVLPVTHL